jgi:carbohydrate diacid regulator
MNHPKFAIQSGHDSYASANASANVSANASALSPVLTPTLAQQIAGETSAIIGFNVLITDPDGTVIGSGDTNRVGTFHEASVDVMRTRRPAAHSSAQARDLRGVRPGVTLPIFLDDSPVGTVGITGAPKVVRRFGLVVKRQTEILLQESVLLRSRLLHERALEDLVRDIAHFDADVVAADFVAYRAGELGYDLALPRAVVVIEIGNGSAAPALRAALLRAVRSRFDDPQDVIAALAPDRLVALRRLPGPRMPGPRAPSPRMPGPRPAVRSAAGGTTGPAAGAAVGPAAASAAALPNADLVALCHQIAGDIGQRFDLPARIGVGDRAGSVAGLHDSYHDAVIALRLGRSDSDQPAVHTIDDLRIHQLLASVGQHARTRFTDALIGSLRAETDWPVLRGTLVAWCESGFNLVHASAALHIHRNTLVYRLAKISRLTGRQPQAYQAMFALYLAALSEQIHTE